MTPLSPEQIAFRLMIDEADTADGWPRALLSDSPQPVIDRVIASYMNTLTPFGAGPSLLVSGALLARCQAP